MGAFYGAIFARDIPQKKMETAAKSIAKTHHCSLYVAPTIRGWSAIYPSESGQDERISNSLAKKLKGEVIHVIVHDDDVFLYFYYRDGKLLDKFNSNPDYFEPATKKARLAQHGNPSAFADLLPDQEHVEALADFLEQTRSEKHIFASDALAEFAELFGLPNALTSYDYLSEGETERIEEWERFVSIEAGDGNVGAVKGKAGELPRLIAADREAKAMWISKGMLLVDRVSTGTPDSDADHIFCCKHPVRDEIYVCFTEGKLVGQFPLECYAFPWTAAPRQTGIVISGLPSAMQISPSGDYFVVGYRTPTPCIEVWSLADESKCMELELRQTPLQIDFSSDGQQILILTNDSLYIALFDQSQAVQEIMLPHAAQNMSVHPEGEWVVINGTDRLILLSILTQSARTLSIPPPINKRAQGKRSIPGIGLSQNEEIRTLIIPPSGKGLFMTALTPPLTRGTRPRPHEIRFYDWASIVQAQDTIPQPKMRLPSDLTLASDSLLIGLDMPESLVQEVLSDSFSDLKSLTLDTDSSLLIWTKYNNCVSLDLKRGILTPFWAFSGLWTLSVDITAGRSALYCIGMPYTTAEWYAKEPKTIAGALQIWDYQAILRHNQGREYIIAKLKNR